MHDDITKQKLLLQDKGKLITARRILCMINASLSTDTNMMEVVTICSPTDMKWEVYGDVKARQFYSTWTDRASRLDCQLDNEHLRDILFTEMKKNDGLKLALHPFKKLKKEDRKYCELFDIFRIWLKETKEEANLKKGMDLTRTDDTTTTKRKVTVIKGDGKEASSWSTLKGKS